MPDQQWVDEPVPCRDPDCAEQGGVGEPDGDSETRFYVCNECGYEFGFQRVKQGDSTCQIGVDESVRRRFSVPPKEPVLLQIGRRPPDV